MLSSFTAGAALGPEHALEQLEVIESAGRRYAPRQPLGDPQTPDRRRAAFALWLDGATCVEVAAELGCHRERARQLIFGHAVDVRRAAAGYIRARLAEAA